MAENGIYGTLRGIFVGVGPGRFELPTSCV